MRAEAARWCLRVAGMRVHGTTRKRPLAVFQGEERHALLPWDGEPYDVGDWRTAKIHPDHHIQCRQSLYSVPSGVCPPGQEVEVRVGSKLVRIYHRGRLIKVHQRQPKGVCATDPDDYPAELSAYTTRAPDHIKREAAKLGPAVDEFARSLFKGKGRVPWAKIRQGHKLLADEAHFRADAEMRGKWVLRGEPAPVFTRASIGGLDQPEIRREGQLLFGGVRGDWRSGVDGTGGQQQRRDLGGLSGPVASEALWPAQGDLGQRAGAPRRGRAGVSAEARTGNEAGEPAGVQPGLQR